MEISFEEIMQKKRFKNIKEGQWIVLEKDLRAWDQAAGRHRGDDPDKLIKNVSVPEEMKPYGGKKVKIKELSSPGCFTIHTQGLHFSYNICMIKSKVLKKQINGDFF